MVAICRLHAEGADATLINSLLQSTGGVLLTTLKPTAVHVGAHEFMVNDSIEHKKPTINGKVCTEWLFAHADSSLTYTVSPGTTYFTAIGFSFLEKGVKFLVKSEGKVLFESGDLKDQPDQLQAICVKLPENIKTIELAVVGIPNITHRWSAWVYPTFRTAKP
jgi:hypothetical protein